MGVWPYPWDKQPNPLVIPPGFLRNQVQIQAPSGTKDSTGGVNQSWSPILTAMAGIITLAQREVYQTGQFTGQITHRITLRWPGESIVIASEMRVVFGKRIFVIQAPPDNVQERNRVIHLLCLEMSNGGQACS